jgi:hypothetical protein
MLPPGVSCQWAKRQAGHAGIAFTELSNGFACSVS